MTQSQKFYSTALLDYPLDSRCDTTSLQQDYGEKWCDTGLHHCLFTIEDNDQGLQ